jgi:RNA polymerase sigma factor (sigma-70 family)
MTYPETGMTDNLFARARTGDEEAWAELVDQCYDKVRRVVARKLGRLDRRMRVLYESTDFANDVFKSLVAKSDRFDFPSLAALRAYLIQAAEQKVIDEYRRQHRQKRAIDRNEYLGAMGGPEGHFELAGHDPTPSQFAQAEETREQILSNQTGPERQVMELKALSYTNEEAAERTGLHLRKVQRLVQKASNSLRTVLGG